MKKAILISIQPKWVAKILNGEKTIEIRKSMPKCELPIDVYVYCSKGRGSDKNPSLCVMSDLDYDKKTQEFILKGQEYGLNVWKDLVPHFGILDGKVVAKFTLGLFCATIEKVLTNDNKDAIYMLIDQKTRKIHDVNPILKQSCLIYQELEKFGNDKKLYMWHIENLQIFDKFMELNEFYKGNYEYIRDYEGCNLLHCLYARDNSILGDDGNCDDCPRLKVNKAPQSWQYVYVVD